MACPWLVMRLSVTALWVRAESTSAVEVRSSELRTADPSEAGWEHGAVVPGSHWCDVGHRFESLGRDDPAFRPGRDVALIDMAAQLAVSGREQAIASLGTVDDYFGVRRDEPGLATTTWNPDSERLIGLHLDNWDRLPAGRRDNSRNRVNLNLGPEPRAFLFADLDIADACPPEEIPSTVDARRLVREARCPLKVFEVTVPAEWAYIAPTEVLLHDGCSLAQRQGTSHASALGCFAPPPGGSGL